MAKKKKSKKKSNNKKAGGDAGREKKTEQSIQVPAKTAEEILAEERKAEDEKELAELIKTVNSPLPELIARKLLLIKKGDSKRLSLQDISQHQVYVKTLTDKLEAEKTSIERAHKLTNAGLKSSPNDARLNKRMQGIMKRQDLFNQQVQIINEEKEWFYNSPAFKIAHEYVLNNWEETEGGSWVNKAELDEDSKVSFDDLLAELKGQEPPEPK